MAWGGFDGSYRPRSRWRSQLSTATSYAKRLPDGQGEPDQEDDDVPPPTPGTYRDKRGITLSAGGEILRNWKVELPPSRPGGTCAVVGCNNERVAGRSCCASCRERFIAVVIKPKRKTAARR